MGIQARGGIVDDSILPSAQFIEFDSTDLRATSKCGGKMQTLIGR